MVLNELLEIGAKECQSRKKSVLRCCVAAGCLSSGGQAVKAGLEQAVFGILFPGVFGGGVDDEVAEPALGGKSGEVETIFLLLAERGGVGDGFHEREAAWDGLVWVHGLFGG